MTEVTIQIPDGYDLKQVDDGKWELVKKELTLEQIHKDYVPFIETGRLIALSKLMCVADYLNEGWKPNWSLTNNEDKWCVEYIKNTGECYVENWQNHTYGQVIFKTKELALKAIEICGDKLIKTALGV